MDYWLIMTGPEDQPGIDGGLMKREQPGAFTTNTIDVPSVDEFMSKITEAGGKIITPKCQDTEGNTFGIMEEDTSAK
jgi:predicted enzyme related to lactoylglutathione lyase